MVQACTSSCRNRIFYILSIVTAALVIFLGAKSYESFNNVSQNNYREITIEATGSASAVPDIAIIRLGVRSEAATPEEVQAKNTEAINKVNEALLAHGIDKKDIKTEYYYMDKNYVYPEVQFKGEYQEPKENGYYIDQELKVTVRGINDQNKTGEIIQSVTMEGVNTFGNIQFEIEDKDKVIEEARKDALDKAKAKAKILEKDVGVNLGAVIGFYEYADTIGGPYGKGMRLDKSMIDMENGPLSPAIEQGETEIQISVSLTYEIKT